MEIQHDRRRWLREVLNPPEIGILHTGSQGFIPGIHATKQPTALYVDLLNRSMGGVIIKTKWEIEPEIAFYLQIFNSVEESWDIVRATAKWRNKDTANPSYNLIGVEFQASDPSVAQPTLEDGGTKKLPLPADYEFLRHTPLFKFINRNLICPFLNSLSNRHIKAGEKFITQGSKSDAFYVIQKGSCLAGVEDHKKLRSMGRLSDGDHIGDMVLLTDKPQRTHFYAETDMELWGLTRTQFDRIAAEHPELRHFLTELLYQKLSSRGTTTGKRIGKYRVTDIIGYGSNSIVFKARHADLNMPVAVKIIRHDLAMDPQFASSYQEKADPIAHLNHQNIIKIFDIEKRFRTFVITTELLEGETVASLIGRWKTIPIPQTTVFLAHICAGLVYAHQHNIIHGFIKPSNLFVNQGGGLKILDFGIGYPRETRISNLSGEVNYMSPEQFEGGTADARSDIYSLGITAYEMLTGKTPFADDTHPTPADMDLNRPVPDPADHVQELPEILRRFILKACAREPEKRYQSAASVHNDLMVLAKALRLESEIQLNDRRIMTTLFLFHKEEHRLALKQLLEEFSSKTKKLGIDLKASDITDL